MPKKTPSDVLIQIYQLRQDGLTISKIEDRLQELFDEDVIPDQSTISRQIKKFGLLPPEVLSEDVPFVWSAMGDLPWESSRALLEVWGFYHIRSTPQGLFGPFSRRLAKWTWRVLQAVGSDVFPDSNSWGYETTDLGFPVPVNRAFPIHSVDEHLNGYDLLWIAKDYSWREKASILSIETFDTRDLDLKLALRPWQDLNNLKLYHGARDRLGLTKEQVFRSADSEWLRSVTVRSERPGSREEDTESEDLAMRKTAPWYAQAFDGHSFSQLNSITIDISIPNVEPRLAATLPKSEYVVMRRDMEELAEEIESAEKIGAHALPWHVKYARTGAISYWLEETERIREEL